MEQPYAKMQAYDLQDPKQVWNLFAKLTNAFGVEAHLRTVDEFCASVKHLNRILPSLLGTIEDVKEHPDVKDAGHDVHDLDEVMLENEQLCSWSKELFCEMDAGKKVIVVRGSSDGSMGFNVMDIDVPPGYNLLIIEVRGTKGARSTDFDKMLKLDINQRTLTTLVEDHRHWDDEQFTISGDGLFVYELPSVVKRRGRIELACFGFWKIALYDVEIQLYFA